MPVLRSVAGAAVAVMTLSSFLTGAGFLPQLAALPGACAWLAERSRRLMGVCTVVVFAVGARTTAGMRSMLGRSESGTFCF